MYNLFLPYLHHTLMFGLSPFWLYISKNTCLNLFRVASTFSCVSSFIFLTIAQAIFIASLKYSLTFPPNCFCPLFASAHALTITCFALFLILISPFDLLLIVYYVFPYYSTLFIQLIFLFFFLFCYFSFS